jgi:tetraprenyl-beta-curcumene synthase
MRSAALGDRRLAARAGAELILANARYWTTVAPTVRAELARWERRARAIEDPQLRTLALGKLHGEGFHAEAAAMLATLAPRAYRRTVVEAIVALELLFDYLDGLTERSSADPLNDGSRLFEALIDAVAVPAAHTGESLQRPAANDGGYLEALSRGVSTALVRLPAATAITEVAHRTAARSAQAQTRMHAAAQIGTAQLEQWAAGEAQHAALGWRELVAGAASSVLVLHALIAAAADASTTREHATRIADAYLSTCVLLTLLDGLVDHDQDTRGHAENGHGSRSDEGPHGQGYLSLYEHPERLADTLGEIARLAVGQARELPGGAQHVMLLTGVVAYYSSAPGSANQLAQPAIAPLRRELEPLISPTLAVMRAWRRARRYGRADGSHERNES